MLKVNARHRVSRFHKPAVSAATAHRGQHQRTVLDKDQQAMVMLKYRSLPAIEAARRETLVAVVQFDVNLQ